MPEAAVTTVVISRDRRDDISATLGRHRPPVILVDNGSSDGTVEEVRRRFPDVRVLALGSNRGAPARNLGVAAATTPYVAFADDDSWWAPGALDTAVAALERFPTLGLVAARVLIGPSERLEPVSVQMAESPLAQRPGLPGTAVLGFIACAAVVRRTAFLEVGGFDDVVFFPGEEQRVAYDLMAAGWGLCYLDDVVVHHHPSPRRSTPAARQALVTRNQLLTAVMRRPWTAVLSQARDAVRSSPAARRGAAMALARLPRALAARRRLPADVEAAIRHLDSSG